ncbi:MAG: hypothetical protein SOX55_00575 [Dysosmobacter sp.]|nr:hypothetical protein [Dysosmobacter sp.]
MGNFMPQEKRAAIRPAVLRSAALLFLTDGRAKNPISRQTVRTVTDAPETG